MPSPAPTLVWLRNDFRLADNPALASAAERGPVLPVWIHDDESHGAWAPGAASRVWTHHALLGFQSRLSDVGLPLILRSGNSLVALRDLVRETGATGVVWNRRYEPALLETDRQVKAALTDDGLEVRSFPGNLLVEPWEVATKQGNPYKVFTPFWKTVLRDHPIPPPAAVPDSCSTPSRLPDSRNVSELGLLPRGEGDWPDRLIAHWPMGERAALDRLDAFIRDSLDGYDSRRDLPADRDGTSRLSPYLHHGEIGVRTVWHRLSQLDPADPDAAVSHNRYRAELGWREFAHHLLYHFPHTPDAPLRGEFSQFPWADPETGLRPWQRGETGFPIVDAGMRELWATGIMHNRLRMIVASFLTKDQLISWQEGARWFWDTLVDADLASNTLGWQWTAGCGADAAPYFRVFNPTTQAKRYDPDGEYVQRWVTDLHAASYPAPILDHKEARLRALAAYDLIK